VTTIPPGEWKRKAVHAGMGLFALLLRWLTWREAAALALFALLFNLLVMPRFGRGIYRQGSKRHDPGIVAYPATVLALVLVFRHELDVVAVVWAMMAFGDPAASIAGRLVGGPVLPWNPEKTWIGMLANWAAGTLAAVAVLGFYVGSLPGPQVVAILLAGAAVFAFLESVRAGIDDNLVAAIPTALAILTISQGLPRFSPWPGSWLAVPVSAAVNGAVAFATWRLGVVRRSGAIAGAIVGFAVLLAGGPARYGLLWTFFLLGTAATRLGYGRKREAGVAEGERGRRGAANVVANCAVPTAFLILGFPPLAYPGALAAALSDTAATEFGTLFGRRPFSPWTLRPLTVGAPGAVSAPGLLASVAGAAAMAAAAWALAVAPGSVAWAVAAGGIAGSLAESLLKDLGRRAGFTLDHDFANALNTFVGGVSAILLAGGSVSSS